MSRILKTAALALAVVGHTAGPASAETTFPSSLNPIGGYPDKGSVCQQLGQSPATARYLVGSAILVGCPGAPESPFVRKYMAKTGGHVVDEVDGITLVSISQEEQTAIAATRDAAAKAANDAFQPAGQLRCALSPSSPMTRCSFGIAHKGALTVVKINRIDGGGRQIFFANGRVAGADINKADTIAKRRIVTTREVDLFLVAVGEERYEIPANIVSQE